MFSRSIVTLNIEGSSARVLITRGRKVIEWRCVPLTPGLVRDGLISDPLGLGPAFNYLFPSKKASEMKVITSLSGVHSIPRIVSLPEWSESLGHEAIMREAKRLMPVSLDELYLSWQAIGAKAGVRRCYLLGVPRSPVDAHVQALQQAGLVPYLMDVKGMALARAVNRREALVLDLERDALCTTVIAGGIPMIMRTIPLQQETFNLDEIVGRAVEELSRTVELYGATYAGNPLDPATPTVLTGEIANNPDIGRLIQEKIEYPVEQLSPPLICPSHFPISEYAVNIGLALKRIPLPRKLQARSIPLPRRLRLSNVINLNVLPDIYKPPRRPLRKLLLIGAITAVVILLLPMYLLKVDAADETANLRTQLNTVQQQLQTQSEVNKEVKEFEGSINEAIATLCNLEQEHQIIASRGAAFANPWQVVTESLVPGVHLTSIAQSGNELTLSGESDTSGEADARAAVIEYATHLEQTGEFSGVRVDSIAAEGGGQESEVITFTITINR